MLLLYLCTLISPHTTQCTPLADLHTLRKTYSTTKVLVPNNILASEYFLSTRNLFEIMLSYIFPSNVTITCTYEISRMKGSSTYFFSSQNPNNFGIIWKNSSKECTLTKLAFYFQFKMICETPTNRKIKIHSTRHSHTSLCIMKASSTSRKTYNTMKALVTNNILASKHFPSMLSLFEIIFS